MCSTAHGDSAAGSDLAGASQPSDDVHSSTFGAGEHGRVSPRMCDMHRSARFPSTAPIVRFRRSGDPPPPVGSAARESGVRAGAGPRPRRHAPNNDHAGTHRTTTTPAHTRQRPRRHAPDNDHAGTHRTTRRADDHTSRIRTSARPLARGQNRSHLMSTRTALPRWLIASFSASVSSAMVRLSPMASGTNTGS